MDAIRTHVVPPDTTLFFRRDEAGDPRLGETVAVDAAGYASAQAVLIGCPQDEGVRRNGGRVGAAGAPSAIRQWLYRLVSPARVRLFDAGDVRTGGTLEETHATHRLAVEALLRDGKTVISLGGGNDIAYPDCAALSTVAGGDILALNIDAHLDVRESAAPHSGTPYRQLLEAGYLTGERFHETACQPFAVAAEHLAYLSARGVRVHSVTAVRAAGAGAFYRDLIAASGAAALFWGVDMDAMTAADAPGVSAPNPAGLGAADALAIAEVAGSDPRSRIFEITEVNPTFDIDGRTARLAAAAIWTFLNALH